MSAELRPFGPRPAGLDDETCPACRQPIKEGDYTTLVSLGPGDDPEEQERCREGRVYNAVAAQVHWTCGTGLPNEVAKAILDQWTKEGRFRPLNQTAEGD